MADPDILQASCSVVVDLPNFSNEEYLACTPVSHAHKQMFVYRDADEGYVFRNDEMAAGSRVTFFSSAHGPRPDGPNAMFWKLAPDPSDAERFVTNQ